jgi:copper(I)-binding protein
MNDKGFFNVIGDSHQLGSSVCLMRSKFNRLWVVSVISIWLTNSAQASVSIEDSWVAANPPGARVAAMYLSVVNHYPYDVRVEQVEVEGVPRTMFHETQEVDGQMRMRHRDTLTVAANQRLLMQPGGLHVMLMGGGQFEEGQAVEAVLYLADGSMIEFTAQVRAN